MNRSHLSWKVLGITLLVSAVTFGLVALPSTDAQAEETDPANFSLERTDTDAGLLTGLTDALPGKSVGDVLDSANRNGTACKADADHLAASFCWESGDNTVKYWYPQGLTTSADATAEGTVDGREVVVAAWYDNGTSGIDRGARLSFVDMSNPDAPKYRHVLLVEPTGSADEPDFKAVGAHAGGLVWDGNMLYVCDTYDGMRVFDMTKILQVSTGNEKEIGRQSDGSYAAHNYAFAMPQVGWYKPTTTGGVDKLRFSQLGLDKTSDPDSLVVSEYSDTGDGTRIVRFDVDDSGAVLPDDDGVGRADWAWDVSIRSMQGATAIDGRYLIQRSNTQSAPGDMFTWTPGETAQPANGALPGGPEDVSYWAPKDQLWSQTETPGKRVVYATTASAW